MNNEAQWEGLGALGLGSVGPSGTDAGPGRSSEGLEMETGKRSQYGAATSSDSRDHLRLGPAGETMQSHLRAVPFVQKRL